MKLVRQLLLLLSLLPQPTTPALSDFYLPIGSSQNSEPTCIGIDTQYTYLCTDDPAAARNALGLDDIRRNEQMFINTGVDQRISGTESEILNVKEVLMDMAKYMDEEVMSRSEYAHVRGSWWVERWIWYRLLTISICHVPI